MSGSFQELHYKVNRSHGGKEVPRNFSFSGVRRYASTGGFSLRAELTGQSKLNGRSDEYILGFSTPRYPTAFSIRISNSVSSGSRIWPSTSLRLSSVLDIISSANGMAQTGELQAIITAPAGCSKTLHLAGYGVEEKNIEGNQVAVAQLGVYIEKDVTSYLQAWKGKSAQDLAQDNAFFTALIKAPVEKCVKVGLLVGPVPGPHYGSQVEDSIKERLLKEGKLGNAEEKALLELLQFFQPISQLGSSVIYPFPRRPSSTSRCKQMGLMHLTLSPVRLLSLLSWTPFLVGIRSASRLLLVLSKASLLGSISTNINSCMMYETSPPKDGHFNPNIVYLKK